MMKSLFVIAFGLLAASEKGVAQTRGAAEVPADQNERREQGWGGFYKPGGNGNGNGMPMMPPDMMMPDMPMMDPPNCNCEKYLSDYKLWSYIGDILPFPDVCCFLSVLAYYISKSMSNGVDGTMGMQLAPKMSDEEALDQFVASVSEMSALENNRTTAEVMDQLESAFSEENEEWGGGLCSNVYGIPLLKCLLMHKIHEGIDACYCQYRGNLGCTYKEKCTHDLYFDLRIAAMKDRGPFFSCFQCPPFPEDEAMDDMMDDMMGNGGNGNGGNGNGGNGNGMTGYHAYDPLKGKPYEECLGYCFLIGSIYGGC